MGYGTAAYSERSRPALPYYTDGGQASIQKFRYRPPMDRKRHSEINSAPSPLALMAD